MDTLDKDKCRELTRWGELDQVMRGLDAAQDAGLRIKINAVALRGVNDLEFDELIRWSHGRGMDLVLIEVMPMGELGENARLDQYLPLSLVRADLAKRFNLIETDYRTGGPARYFKVGETGGRLGFITPLTHNFCESCNRVRLTCTGTLYMCLGQDDAADLRAPLRASESDELQVGGIVLAQAHIESAGAGQPHAIAAFAEVMGERRDETQPPAGLADLEVARRPAGAIVGLDQVEALGQVGPHHGERQGLVEGGRSRPAPP